MVRERLSSLSGELKLQKSTMLSLALVVHPRVREAKVVALFSPLPDEPQIEEIIDILAGERTVVLPRIEGDIMEFYRYSKDYMRVGAYGIMEPEGAVAVAPEEIDLMLVPGVAFTAAGARLGRGKGYYDKYMSHSGFRAYKVGVCYAEQQLPELPCEPHDILIDEVIAR